MLDRLKMNTVDMKALDKQIKKVSALLGDTFNKSEDKELEGIFEFLCCVDEQIKDNGLMVLREGGQ